MTLASLTFDAPVYKLQSKVFTNESLVPLGNESPSPNKFLTIMFKCSSLLILSENELIKYAQNPDFHIKKVLTAALVFV